MKKSLVPMFLIVCVLLSGGILYGAAVYHYHKQPQYTEYKINKPLTLSQVRQTNVKIEPNASYSLIYRIKYLRYSEGLAIKTSFDTVELSFLATRRHDEGGRVTLPDEIELPYSICH